MKGKPAIAYSKCVIYEFFFYSFNRFALSTRTIFDWCNKIATDGLLNVFDFDCMANKKHLSQKKVRNPFLKCLWVAIWQTGSSHATENLGQFWCK